MSNELEPIAPELAELLGTERRVRAAPQDGKARVRARVHATLFGGGGAGGGSSSENAGRAPGGSTPASSLGRTFATFALGAVVGGGAVYALLPPRVVEQRIEIVVPAQAEERNVDVPRIEHAAPEDPRPEAGAPSGERLAEPDSLAAERALLDPARAALSRGDATSALVAVRKHEQRYPNGKLAEEREAIATQALAVIGRKDEARARGQRFLARYPGSVLAPMVEAAIEAAQ